MRLAFFGGFIAGASAMLGVILWVLNDRELDYLSYEHSGGRYGFRGRLVEWPDG